MQRTNTQSISSRVRLAFTIVVIFMVAMVFLGLRYISSVNSQMEIIVDSNNVKVELAHKMQHALHERALSMHSIAVQKDAFIKDEEYVRFNELGSQYYKARRDLEKLSSNPEEIEILANIRELTRLTQPDVQHVVELGLLNRYDVNSEGLSLFEIIRVQAIPKQRLIIEQVKRLVDLQKSQAQVALTNVQASYIKTRNAMFLLGLFATLVVILISSIVTRRVKKKAAQLEHQALHDELTGLANRVLFTDRLKKSVMRSQRNGSVFSILLLDLNKFKNINDTLGHVVGDLVLQEVARRLKQQVREVDTVARLGGDEFVLLLEPTDNSYSERLAQKLSDAINKPFLLSGEELFIGTSIGVAHFPTHGHDCMSLIKHADAAMYEAKRKGVAFSGAKLSRLNNKN